MTTYKPPAKPWDPPLLTDPELMALKNMAAGNANPHQQKMALTTIVIKFAGAYDMSFRPGGPEGSRETDFAEGKRFVGSRILEAVQRPMEERKDGSSSGGEERPGRRNPKPERPKDRPIKPGGSGSPAG